MENSNKLEKVFKLINHDSSHTNPVFESFTLQDYNTQFGNDYKSIEDAVDSDPEYLFSEEQMYDYLQN